MSLRSFSLISCICKCEVTMSECYTDTVVKHSWCIRLNRMCEWVCVYVCVCDTITKTGLTFALEGESSVHGERKQEMTTVIAAI